MNNKLLKLTAVMTAGAIASVSLPASAHAEFSNDNCDIELNYDLTVSPDHIRIIENDQTLVDIYKDQKLFVKGEEIDLDYSQQSLVTEYSKSIRQSIPEAGELAIEAVTLAYEGIQVALGEHADLSGSREKFDQLEQKISDKFSDKNGHYSFRQGEFTFDGEDSEIDRMVEEIVEDMMPQLIGGILSNIGQAVANGDGDFSSIEQFGENVEREMELRAESIEKSAEEFCYSLKKVDDLENELVASNTKLIYMDLISVKSHHDEIQ
ncbi:MAG: DUF2884 family protein [Gammaproteobacteria bacterium]|nr:DUF2884 family protein [Gammaproteobacteria bacterium]